MLIRSQDKKRLLVLENAYEINITQSTVYMFGSNIGEYKTEEKAIKVLDRMQEAYRSTIQMCISNDTEISCYPRAVVFQMPQDSEV